MSPKAISFQDVVHDIFPSNHKLSTLKNHNSETPLLKTESSQYKLSENSIEHFPSTATLKFRKTTSSIIFIDKMLKRVHSFQQRPPPIDINLNLNNPIDLEKAKTLLKKRKETRTVQEIKMLAKAFENMDLFREIKGGVDPLLYERLFKELLYEKFASNTFIFQINDPPDKLYIVLSGEVSILIPKETNLSSFEKFSGRKMESFENLTFPGYVIMNTMRQFQSFGEIALRNNAARTASAACTSSCELISLDYKTFRVVLRAFFDSQTSEKLESLRKIPIFKSIPNHLLQGLLMHLKEKKYNKKDVIYQEGSKLDSLYIIKEGEAQASKVIDLKNMKNSIIEDKCDSKEKMHEIWNQIDLEKFKELNSSWARKLFQQNKKHQTLFILSKGQSFGEKGLITKRNQEDFSMVCRSPEAVLYLLPYEKILENLRNLDEVYDLQLKSSLEKMKDQKAFISKVIYTEGVILQEMSRKEENIEEKIKEIELDFEGACIRSCRPENQAYELKNKAKYHYTTRYLPSNLLLKRELEERKEKGFEEFTLEKNLVKMFNPTRVLRKTKNFNNNSNPNEIIKGNKEFNSIRTFTDIVKDLEVKTKKNMPDVILYKSLKVKDEAVQKVYKYCSKKLKNSNGSMGKIRKEKAEEKGIGKKKGGDCLYNFCNFEK